MINLPKEKEAFFDLAQHAVKSEVHHAGVWEELRIKYPEVATKSDSDKSFEDWLGWAMLELRMAQETAYYSFNKLEAMEHVRKACGHLFRAMMYYGVRSRTEEERKGLYIRAKESILGGKSK